MDKKQKTEQPTSETKNAKCENAVGLRHGLYAKNIMSKIKQAHYNGTKKIVAVLNNNLDLFVCFVKMFFYNIFKSSTLFRELPFQFQILSLKFMIFRLQVENFFLEIESLRLKFFIKLREFFDLNITAIRFFLRGYFF
jgi:hypothetical protein